MKNAIYLAFLILLTGCAATKQQPGITLPDITKDSTIIIERTVHDTFIIPDNYVDYIDSTDCPPGKDTVTLIKQLKIPVPGKTITVERIVRDTTTIRTNLTTELRLRRTIELLNDRVQAQESEIRSTRLSNFAWIVGLGLALAIAIVIAILSRRKSEQHANG